MISKPDYVYKAYVRSVYDGDTITVDIDVGFGITLTSQKIRLRGIDTPEVRGESREAGLVSRDYLRNLIQGKWILLKTEKDKKGKYGRWIGTIYLSITNKEDKTEVINVNDRLIVEGLAKVYGE